MRPTYFMNPFLLSSLIQHYIFILAFSRKHGSCLVTKMCPTLCNTKDCKNIRLLCQRPSVRQSSTSPGVCSNLSPLSQ